MFARPFVWAVNVLPGCFETSRANPKRPQLLKRGFVLETHRRHLFGSGVRQKGQFWRTTAVSVCHERPPRPSRSRAVSAFHERPPRPSRSGRFPPVASPAPVSLGGGFGLSRASPAPVLLGGGFRLSRASTAPVSLAGGFRM